MTVPSAPDPDPEPLPDVIKQLIEDDEAAWEYITRLSNEVDKLQAAQKSNSRKAELFAVLTLFFALLQVLEGGLGLLKR